MRSSFLVLTMSLLLTTKAFALFSTLDTAEILKTGEYEMGLEPQIVFNGDSRGFNAVARFDMGLGGDSGLRFLAGTGKTTFQGGGFLKLVPWPDYENQPGIGALAGVIFTNTGGKTGLHFRFHPLVSKKFVTEGAGTFTPYFSIPLGISSSSGRTTNPVHVAIGTKWLPQGMEYITFWTEFGMGVNSTFNYLSFNASLPFDGDLGPQFK